MLPFVFLYVVATYAHPPKHSMGWDANRYDLQYLARLTALLGQTAAKITVPSRDIIPLLVTSSGGDLRPDRHFMPFFGI